MNRRAFIAGLGALLGTTALVKPQPPIEVVTSTTRWASEYLCPGFPDPSSISNSAWAEMMRMAPMSDGQNWYDPIRGVRHQILLTTERGTSGCPTMSLARFETET